MKIKKANKKDLKEIANIMKEEFSKPPYNEKDSLKDIIKSAWDWHKNNPNGYRK